MSGRTWVYSDPHFYHGNICKFESSPGVKLRPWDDAEQMTEDMIRWYNEMVDDDRYFYACVEQTNFRPILLDDILKARGVV